MNIRFIGEGRRSPRYPGFDYSTAAAYFVTICTLDRGNIFGEIHAGVMELNEYGKMIPDAWSAMAARFPGFILDHFVVMPNHFHAIICGVGIPNPVGAPLAGAQPGRAGASPAPTVSDVIGAFKSITTVEFIRLQKQKNPKAYSYRLWQRSFHDHIIRDQEEWERIRHYIDSNPQNWKDDEMYLKD